MRGTVLHADETTVHLQRGVKGYVWVFTNLEEVVFMYRSSREGSFLHDLLKDFHGVLISDFYAPYDAVACAQQKCLIHLIRDFNHDIQRNPWDEELKALAADFGAYCGPLLSPSTATLRNSISGSIGRTLTRSFMLSRDALPLRSHRRVSEETAHLSDKLFTFLRYDGVPGITTMRRTCGEAVRLLPRDR